jgi:hypothetical protein
MFYKNLVHFEPIEDIIQIRDADSEKIAHRHVETYVISQRMGDNLTTVVFPQLQFENPQNNKGVLIVGNYGTGKSHLMSVLSSIAEYPDFYKDIRNADVAEQAKSIAGKFKVWRIEIGGVTRSLRNIILDELEGALAEWGTPYTFPSGDEVTNHKDMLIEAVATMQEEYPDKGLLLVVDELLDYLRSRKMQELILDLGFLRELGEVAALTPFRFMAGLQETLFENPRFSFVNEQLRRVKDRFEQVRIAREDIAYVVEERLLKKDDAQKALIREHLMQFAPLYPNLAERMDKFVNLFPIHPAYIEAFENVHVAEKREALKTFSRAMQVLLGETVPQDEPGLLAYDQYWRILSKNPSMRSIPEIKEVVDKSGVLEGRIKSSFERKHLLTIALRIVHALSVQRLTTQDIHSPLGVTPEELRDTLFLHVPLPGEADADLLLDQIRVALGQIMRTVSGQYISHNEENDQYYLDVKKDIDFDAKIQQCGEALDDAALDYYFFDALRQVLGLSDSTYTSAAQIWFHELPWTTHKVTRPGYFFFCAPNERTTAQPPRDFYVYFLPPFDSPSWKDEKQDDEVIFQLKGLDADFKSIVEQYAGASAMANDSPEHRTVYLDKADTVLRKKLSPWLRENIPAHLQVVHEGVSQPLRVVLRETSSTASQNLAELLNIAAAHLLSTAFADRYPEYPNFERAQQPISEAARQTTATMDAIRSISGRPTALGRAVLHGLGLLDKEDRLRPKDSPYAQHYLDLLRQKNEGQVVNRGEIVEKVAEAIDRTIFKDIRFSLEPEWVVVVLLSLVYNGEIVLNLDGKRTLDAGVIETATTIAMDTLADFRHYARPRALPTHIWSEVFESLGLAPGLIRDESKHDLAVKSLQSTVQAELTRTATLDSKLQSGLALWNTPIFTDKFTMEAKRGVIVSSDLPENSVSIMDFKPAFRGYKTFLEKLSRINTVGKLRNIKLTREDISDALEYRKRVQRGEELRDAIHELQELTGYLATARAYLPDTHTWSQRADQLQLDILNKIRLFACGDKTLETHAIKRELAEFKKEYIATYAELHRQMVLGASDDARRKKLYDAPEHKALKALVGIDLLHPHAGLLNVWDRQISDFRPCPTFHEGVLDDSAICPDCKSNPAIHRDDVSATIRLTELEERLTKLITQWQQALRDALDSEAAKASLKAMTSAERKPIDVFLAQDDDNPNIPITFIDSANRALRGIQAVTLSVNDLLIALETGGLPCTVDEMKARINRFLRDSLRGHDESTTRLTLDR